jgi:hypothetical protein
MQSLDDTVNQCVVVYKKTNRVCLHEGITDSETILAIYRASIDMSISVVNDYKLQSIQQAIINHE